MSRKDENTEFNYLNQIPDSSPNHQYATHFNTHTAHVYAETPAFHPYVEPPNIYPSYSNYPGPYNQATIKSDHHYPPSACSNLMYQNGGYEMGSKERSVMFPTRTFSGNDLLTDNSPITGRGLRRLNTEVPIASANFCDFGTYDPFQGSPLEITNLGLHESRSTIIGQPYDSVKVTPVKVLPEVEDILLASTQNEHEHQQQEQQEQLQHQSPQTSQHQDISQHVKHEEQNHHQSKRSYKDALTFPTRSESPVNQQSSSEGTNSKQKADNETRKETYKDKLLSGSNKAENISNATKASSSSSKAINLNNHRSQSNNINLKKPLKINNNLAGSTTKSTTKGLEKNWHSHNESVRSVRSQTDLGGVKRRNHRQSLASAENTSFEFPPSEDEGIDDGDEGMCVTSASISVEVRSKEKKSRSKIKEKENERGSGCSRRNPHKRNPPSNSRAAFARAYLPKVVRFCGWLCVWLYNLCVDIIRMSWDLTLHGMENCQLTIREKGTMAFNWLRTQSRKGSRYVVVNWIPPIKEFFRFFRRKPQQKEDGTQSGGLNANIPLPTTGEEAMHRLLACKGRDPYSILGVRRDSSDEEIRRYYKRQAVLVHPDKNRQRGAEEAFKILAHAFELIGQPERRSRYDQLVQEADEMETAWAELNQLLSKLHAKMDEAANTIRCTNCAKRHRRLKTERPCYAARYCQECKIHHSAREGDLWAESRYMGLISNYYACMEGAVYDITDWANCQSGHLRHLQSNSHRVQYRIVPGQGQSGHHGPGASRSKSAS